MEGNIASNFALGMERLTLLDLNDNAITGIVNFNADHNFWHKRIVSDVFMGLMGSGEDGLNKPEYVINVGIPCVPWC